MNLSTLTIGGYIALATGVFFAQQEMHLAALGVLSFGAALFLWELILAVYRGE